MDAKSSTKHAAGSTVTKRERSRSRSIRRQNTQEVAIVEREKSCSRENTQMEMNPNTCISARCGIDGEDGDVIDANELEAFLLKKNIPANVFDKMLAKGEGIFQGGFDECRLVDDENNKNDEHYDPFEDKNMTIQQVLEISNVKFKYNGTTYG